MKPVSPFGGPGDLISGMFERAVRAGCFPGCIAGILDTSVGREPLIISTGRTVLDSSGTRPSIRTLYDLASLTKPLVVLTLFLLARRDDPGLTQRAIGECVGDVGYWADVSFEAFLTHTSGMPAWVPLYARGVPSEEIVTIFSGIEPVARPGERCIYSCPGFILLGVALEQIYQERLEVLFRQNVAEVLGIEREVMFHPDIDAFPVAGGSNAPSAERTLAAREGFDPSTIPVGGPGLPDDGNARFFRGAAGNAGLFGSVFGVLTLARLYLDGSEGFLGEEEIRYARTLKTPELEQHRSPGWQVASSPGCSAGPGLSPSSIGHTGFTGPSLWIDFERGRILVLLTNRHHPGHRPDNNLHPFRRRFHRVATELLESGGA